MATLLRRATFFVIVSLIMGLAAGCSSVAGEPLAGKTAVSPATTIAPATPLPSSATPSPTLPSPSPTSSPPPTATPSPPPPDLSISQSDVRLYPVPQVYAGDKVTFQIAPHVPDNLNPEDVTITVYVDGLEIGAGVLNERNLSGDAFGLLKWGWNTTGLTGAHQIQVILDQSDNILAGDENPHNNQVSFYVSVHDPALLPETDANATWVTADTPCCHVYVLSGTAAYRDLPQLLPVVETAVQQAAARLDETPQQPVDIYFIDRIIGQGGYAGSALVVSYTDRDYASIALHQVLVHETVHILDRQFAPQRIAFLAEGLAVWVSDGHYKPEDIEQQAAALLELELAIPLADLADDFYPVQHEIGYLEAASFVNYLIDQFGWSRFRTFYQDVTLDDATTPAESLDINLQIHYNQTLADMEADWLAYLESLPWNETAVTDLQTTLFHYNTMRRYQRLYDPAAHFLSAWLPYPNEVRQTGNPADLTRHPQTETNITLETMLQAAGEALQTGSYSHANVILNSVERVLNNNGLFQDPLALSYRNIVRLATANDYQVQKVNLSGNRAVVWVTDAHSNALTQLNLILNGQDWILTN